MSIEELDDNQTFKLTQLRKSLEDCELHDSSDTFLLSWLIARNFDLDNAEKMLRESLKWRSKNRVNSILKEFVTPEVIEKYFPVAPVGQDKWFGPLWLVRHGRQDTIGILKSVRKGVFIRNLIKLIEMHLWLGKNFPEYRRPKEGSLVKGTFIFDMEGLSMKQLVYKPAIDVAIQMIEIYQNNYPEVLRKVFVINAPKIFSMAYSIIRPLLNERTANKMVIYGHDQSEWKQAILADVDADQLPSCYGGTSDTKGCCTGGPVPSSYYLSNIPELEEDTADKKVLVLQARSEENLIVHVTHTGSILCWDFYSLSGGVGFSVFHKDNKNAGVMNSIVPYSRVDCHMNLTEGKIKCDQPGIYVIKFDNSFSYLRSKQVWYSIVIELPKTVVV